MRVSCTTAAWSAPMLHALPDGVRPTQSVPLTGVSGHTGSLCHTAGVLLSPLTLQELHCVPPSGHPWPLQQLWRGLA